MSDTAAACRRDDDGEHRTRTVDGTDLHYVRAGARGGMPLVLVHGWPETWYAWRKVIPALAREYEVYAVDLPGLGDSGTPPGGPGIRTAAALLERWRRDMGLDGVHVVGHDLGGPTAYAWAALQREKVRSLTVLGVPLHGAGLQEFIDTAGLWHFGFFAEPGLAESLAAGRERLLLEHFYGPARRTGALTDQDITEYLRSYGRPGGLATSLAYYRDHRADTEAFTRFAGTKLSIPALGVGGDLAGGPVPQLSLARVAEDVRGAVLSQCGHFLAEEQPGHLTEVLLDFLAGVDRAAG